MHLHRLTLSVALASVAIAAFVAPAVVAGGWAVTTLDELPAVITAGETYSIGYTIRQHGQTPFTSARAAIEIRSSRDGGGGTLQFIGKADGVPGHYVSQVRFPEPGEWQWLADQNPFDKQPLGSITVAPAAAAAVPDAAVVAAQPAVVEANWPTLLRLGLPIATVLAIAVFAWRVGAFLRGRRTPVVAAR